MNAYAYNTTSNNKTANNYTHLSREERIIIQRLYNEGSSSNKITKMHSHAHSTIYRESNRKTKLNQPSINLGRDGENIFILPLKQIIYSKHCNVKL